MVPHRCYCPSTVVSSPLASSAGAWFSCAGKCKPLIGFQLPLLLSSTLPSVGATVPWDFFFPVMFYVAKLSPCLYLVYSCVRNIFVLAFLSFFDSVMPPQPITDGRVIISNGVQVRLKGISRVMALFMSPVLGIHVRLKGLETRINLSSPRASPTGKSSLGASSSSTVEGPT